MGAWGVKVLQNDYALDDLFAFDNVSDFSQIYKLTENLLHSEDIRSGHHILLGVSIVDASINGVDPSLFSNKDTMYDYRRFFERLKLNPMYDLVDTAKESITAVIESGVGYWDEDCQAARMQVYEAFKDRLEKIETEKTCSGS